MIVRKEPVPAPAPEAATAPPPAPPPPPPPKTTDAALLAVVDAPWFTRHVPAAAHPPTIDAPWVTAQLQTLWDTDALPSALAAIGAMHAHGLVAQVDDVVATLTGPVVEGQASAEAVRAALTLVRATGVTHDRYVRCCIHQLVAGDPEVRVRVRRARGYM